MAKVDKDTSGVDQRTTGPGTLSRRFSNEVSDRGKIVEEKNQNNNTVLYLIEKGIFDLRR